MDKQLVITERSEDAVRRGLDELFDAIHRVARIILEEGLHHRTLGILTVLDVGHLIGTGSRLERTRGSQNLDIVI